MVAKEKGSHKRQFLKLLKRYGLFQKLPFRLQWKEFIDKFFWVCQKVVVVIFISRNVTTKCNATQLGCVQISYLRLSDFAFPGFGTSLALTR